MISQEIQYDRKNPEFSKEIVEVDQNYLKTTSVNNFELVSQDQDSLPLWILHDFQQNRVRLWGKFPENFDQTQIQLNLFDKKTRLFSENIYIQMKVLERDDNSQYFLRYTVIGVICFVVGVFIIKLFVKKTPKQMKEKNESQDSVLTNSIILWNRKMVEKY